VGCARELAAWGPVSKLTGLVEDVKSWESDADVGSHVWKFLLRYGLDSRKKSLPAEQVPRIMRRM